MRLMYPWRSLIGELWRSVTTAVIEDLLSHTSNPNQHNLSQAEVCIHADTEIQDTGNRIYILIQKSRDKFKNKLSLIMMFTKYSYV